MVRAQDWSRAGFRTGGGQGRGQDWRRAGQGSGLEHRELWLNFVAE